MDLGGKKWELQFSPNNINMKEEITIAWECVGFATNPFFYYVKGSSVYPTLGGYYDNRTKSILGPTVEADVDILGITTEDILASYKAMLEQVEYCAILDTSKEAWLNGEYGRIKNEE